ncbi:uncharacterized protein RSE6_05343 [Rhynchosporium secalis]|uniref:Uncharacterized protein n=1 Tax=Rhynchosporium secalis TaxID=38038 RepID=A0A1E1M7J2_RHYSE|nr:uncharacterized protein RSE6_05343 [Rhynchosporium secalis]
MFRGPPAKICASLGQRSDISASVSPFNPSLPTPESIDSPICNVSASVPIANAYMPTGSGDSDNKFESA